MIICFSHFPIVVNFVARRLMNLVAFARVLEMEITCSFLNLNQRQNQNHNQREGGQKNRILGFWVLDSDPVLLTLTL